MFTHHCNVEIRFVDIDAFGHVNNAHHLSYIEQARVRYFNDVVGGDWDWTKAGIILATAEVRYKQPILLHDRLRIYTRCSRIGGKSMELEYRLVNSGSEGEVLLAEARTVVVAYDYTSAKTTMVSEDWRVAILAYELPGAVICS